MNKGKNISQLESAAQEVSQKVAPAITKDHKIHHAREVILPPPEIMEIGTKAWGWVLKKPNGNIVQVLNPHCCFYATVYSMRFLHGKEYTLMLGTQPKCSDILQLKVANRACAESLVRQYYAQRKEVLAIIKTNESKGTTL